MGLKKGSSNRRSVISLVFLMILPVLLIMSLAVMPSSVEASGGRWAPTITSYPATSAYLDAQYSYTPTANCSVTWTVLSIPGWASWSNGVLQGTVSGTSNYSVSLEATSTAGLGNAYQNFTIVGTVGASQITNNVNGVPLTTGEVIALFLLAIFTYVGLNFRPFFIVTGFVFLAVGFFYVEPIDNWLGLTTVSVGLITMMYGVYYASK